MCFKYSSVAFHGLRHDKSAVCTGIWWEAIDIFSFEIDQLQSIAGVITCKTLHKLLGCVFTAFRFNRNLLIDQTAEVLAANILASIGMPFKCAIVLPIRLCSTSAIGDPIAMAKRSGGLPAACFKDFDKGELVLTKEELKMVRAELKRFLAEN
eukprot:s1692_g7.t1